MADSIRKSIRAARTAATLGVACLLPDIAAAADRDALRDHFADAYYAAVTGADLTDRGDDAQLRDYALYPYLEAARIAKALSLTDGGDAGEHDGQALEFLARHDGEPVADVLALAWLESLARRGRAAALVAHYRADIATPRVECAWLAARIETGAIEGLAPAIIERWRTPARLPIECERPFEWLRAEGVLDAARTEERIRLLLESGQAAFARVIARRLPDARAARWLRWADLIESPRATLDALTDDPTLTVDPHALLDGFARLARDEPGAAAERYEPLIAARGLDAREASLAARALAYGLAWDRDARALDYFARVDPAHIDDYTLQWQARAALWARDWPLVAESIAAMSPGAAAGPGWTYWAARAAEALGDGARARASYEAVIGTDNFYAALAAARLDRRVNPRQIRLERDDETVDSLRRADAFVRARELRAVDLPSEALREWRHARSRLTPDEARQSIHLAADWGWYDVAVATATRHDVFFDYRLLYPRPYRPNVAAASRLTRLDRPLIYGVMRQESLYRADAASPAGALGLMQLTPATARRAADEWQRARPSRSDLFDPATSIELGAAHLRSLVQRFDSQLAVALAAYNAGPAAVEPWLPAAPLDLDVWVENIPYNETRAYVRRVMWHSLVFKWLDEQRPQTARSWLAEIEAPASEPGSG